MLEIPELTDAEVAFPSAKYLPAIDKIPEEFKTFYGTKWNKVFSRWFYEGIRKQDLIAKKGVDKNKALRAILACMQSFEPKHVHKEAGCAYMLSQWFDKYLPFEEEEKKEGLGWKLKKIILDIVKKMYGMVLEEADVPGNLKWMDFANNIILIQ